MANIKLVGPKAKLVNEACEIKDTIKTGEKRLAEIKKALGYKAEATYVTLKGCTLTIGKMRVYEEITPKKLADYLKKKNKLGSFYDCVKVNLTDTRKVVPEEDLEKLRPELASSTKWTYK